jgi:undecaprenyl-diphosphatase
VRGPAAVGAIAAAFTTFLAVRFLLRYFRDNRLTPFGIYCLVAGIVCSLIFAF